MDSLMLKVMMGVAVFAGACAAQPADDSSGAANGDGGTAAGAAAGAAAGGVSSTGTSGAATSSGGSGTVVQGGAVGVSGSPGNGGAGAAGGMVPSGCTAVDSMTVISDFETGKADVIATAGRDGSWFLLNDKTASGVQSPVKIPNTPLEAGPGGACGSAFAFHTTAAGFTTWGAGIGTDFAPKTATGERGVYNLSAYSALALRAKAAATTPVRVSISDANTAPEGKVCVDTTDKTEPKRCGDYFSSEITVGPEYQDFIVKFTDLKQRNLGLQVATGFDKTRAYTIRLISKADFDLWIDDVRLVP